MTKIEQAVKALEGIARVYSGDWIESIAEGIQDTFCPANAECPKEEEITPEMSLCEYCWSQEYEKDVAAPIAEKIVKTMTHTTKKEG